MDQHALAILKQNSIWNWPNTKRIQAPEKQAIKLESITPKLLYYLILESQRFGGEVLNHFWNQLGSCDTKLKVNIESLKKEEFKSANRSFEVLFRGLDPKDANFEPVFMMAAEYFTHLGVAFMNTGGRKSGTDTEFSVSEIVGEETNKLLQLANEGEFGKRKQECLKALSFKRDGIVCQLTRMTFRPFGSRGIYPALAHIIPNAVHGNPDTLRCIAMFAGAAARDDVVNHVNNIGNVMNMELNAHSDYNGLDWGIEAKEEGGEVKYFFRLIPTVHIVSGPGFIALKEGDEIQFGQGPDGKRLDKGPIPRLCNLRLAVARALKMSGAADIILEWIFQADDDGVPHPFIASEDFCDMLDAKLFLSGKAIVI